MTAKLQTQFLGNYRSTRMLQKMLSMTRANLKQFVMNRKDVVNYHCHAIRVTIILQRTMMLVSNVSSYLFAKQMNDSIDHCTLFSTTTTAMKVKLALVTISIRTITTINYFLRKYKNSGRNKNLLSHNKKIYI